MRDVTIKNEFIGVQGQIDNLGKASNVQTDGLSELIVQTRALFNLINKSWILSVVFGLGAKKLVAEMKRVNEVDAKQRQAMYAEAEKQKQTELEAANAAALKKKNQAELDHKVTKRERQLKKLEKQS